MFFLDLKVLLYESRIFSFFFLNNQRNSHLNLLNTNLYGIFFFNSKLLCFFCGERLILTCLDFLRFFVFNTFSAFYYFFCINLFYFSNLSCLIQPKFLKFIKKTYPADFFIRYLSFALIFLFSLNCKSLYLKNLHFQKYKQVSYNVFT